MSDASDVEQVLADTIAGILYPKGTAFDSALNANLGTTYSNIPCKVRRGWPSEAQILADTKAGILNVTVYGKTFGDKLTSRYLNGWLPLSISVQTLIATVSANIVTFSGTISLPCNVSVTVDRASYVYSVQPSDTLSSIAGALAALIAVNTPATSSGAVLTVLLGASVSCAIGGSGTAIRELRRQERTFQIILWAPSIDSRDQAASLIDSSLAAINFLTMPDGFGARLLYKGTLSEDTQQKAGLYRRDLLYLVEYATTQIETETQVVAVPINLTGSVI